MDKYLLSERDICTKFITPAIQRAGWQPHQFREEACVAWISEAPSRDSCFPTRSVAG